MQLGKERAEKQRAAVLVTLWPRTHFIFNFPSVLVLLRVSRMQVTLQATRQVTVTMSERGGVHRL